MIIILEGPEAAGKTTLARQLAAQTGFAYSHRSKPKNEEERRQMLQDYATDIKSNVNQIWDRCWYSEMIYGKVMRDQSVISVAEMYALEVLLATHGGGIIIHCTDEVELLWARSQARGEDYITDVADLTSIKFEYEDLLHGITHTLPITRYELSKILPQV